MSKQLQIQVDIIMGQCRVETRRVASDGSWTGSVEWYDREAWDGELSDDDLMVEAVADVMQITTDRDPAPARPWTGGRVTG